MKTKLSIEGLSKDLGNYLPTIAVARFVWNEPTGSISTLIITVIAINYVNSKQ